MADEVIINIDPVIDNIVVNTTPTVQPVEIIINDGAPGENGTDGINGTNGTNGKSAYQTWLDAGNTGTETDFIISLGASMPGYRNIPHTGYATVVPISMDIENKIIVVPGDITEHIYDNSIVRTNLSEELNVASANVVSGNTEIVFYNDLTYVDLPTTLTYGKHLQFTLDHVDFITNNIICSVTDGNGEVTSPKIIKSSATTVDVYYFTPPAGNSILSIITPYVI